jgi:hypothetical protein
MHWTSFVRGAFHKNRKAQADDTMPSASASTEVQQCNKDMTLDTGAGQPAVYDNESKVFSVGEL